MKKFAILLHLFLAIANTAGQTKTSNIPNYKFETIEKIRLGLSKGDFLNELKLLKIKNQDYSTNMIMRSALLNKNLEENNLINSSYIDAFNFDEYKVFSKLIEHPALIYSESIDNINITSITILLGHTGKALGFTKADSLKKRILYFKQDISQDLFFNIVDLYEHKYGRPEVIQDTTSEVKYYRLYKNNILTEKTKPYNNYIIKWKTEFINIEIFPGFNYNAFFIPNEFYSTSSNWIYSNYGEEPLEDNQKQCFTFPYIKYELNEKALQMLVINKLKI